MNKRIYTSFKKLSHISEHVSSHKTHLNDLDFGYFLAGLIEADGYFGDKTIHIVFCFEDTSLAYLIKKRIGYGNVYKIKNKNAVVSPTGKLPGHPSGAPVRYVCRHSKGLHYIISLINGKLISTFKYKQLLNNNYSEWLSITILPPLKILTLDNYWLSGFTQGNGCFHISMPKSKSHSVGYSVRLEYSIKQKDPLPLHLLYELIKHGNLSKYNTADIWCYKSSGYKTAFLLIQYFDKYNLFAGKYIQYLKFRKVYIMITEGKHLTKKGIQKIKSIKTKGSSETSTQEV